MLFRSPTVRRAIHVEEGVLLLNTEPGDLLLGLLHDFGGVVTVVGPVGGAVVVIALGEDEDVVTAAEGVLEDGSGTEVDVGIASGSLVGRRAVEIPDTERADVLNLLEDSLKRVCQNDLCLCIA